MFTVTVDRSDSESDDTVILGGPDLGSDPCIKGILKSSRREIAISKEDPE